MALIVGGANALNMVIERDMDRRMTRTRLRPLPAGRLAPQAGAHLRYHPFRPRRPGPGVRRERAHGAPRRAGERDFTSSRTPR